jgi:hypothetical protein
MLILKSDKIISAEQEIAPIKEDSALDNHILHKNKVYHDKFTLERNDAVKFLPAVYAYRRKLLSTSDIYGRNKS